MTVNDELERKLMEVIKTHSLTQSHILMTETSKHLNHFTYFDGCEMSSDDSWNKSLNGLQILYNYTKVPQSFQRIHINKILILDTHFECTKSNSMLVS
jgi:hypothetical protein